MARLEKLLNDRESGLGSATSQIASLREVVDRLKQELNSTRNDLIMTKSKASSIEVRTCSFNLNCFVKLTLQRKIIIRWGSKGGWSSGETGLGLFK